MNKTIILAHRGVSEFAPENTLPALEMAMNLDCHGIEFDVHLTKDGIPVIIHDETIDRTSTGMGYVKDLTLEELEAFDFGVKFHPKFTGVTIPTLEEFFQLAKEKKYKGIINVEIKNDIVDYPEIEEKVLSLIDYYGFSNQILISSFNHDCIAKVRELSSEAMVALLYDEKMPPAIYDLSALKAYSANIEFSDFSLKLLDELEKEKLKLLCYTINSKEDLEKYIDYGVHGIFTNNPELGMEILKNRDN